MALVRVIAGFSLPMGQGQAFHHTTLPSQMLLPWDSLRSAQNSSMEKEIMYFAAAGANAASESRRYKAHYAIWIMPTTLGFHRISYKVVNKAGGSTNKLGIIVNE